MTIAVLTEKPSVARDIARVLNAERRRSGFFEGGGYRITWALGHLVELPEPHQIDASWKRWSLEQLPMLPRRWPLQVVASTREQFEVVRQVLLGDDVEAVVCATDAGREGELIFRYIVEATGCAKPLRRLWISSLTTQAIRAGFEELRDAREFDGLGAAARARSHADWVVGMNLTRAYTLAERRAAPRDLDRPTAPARQVLSVGRVQTPTLAMLVDREQSIRSFVPEDYIEVEATFQPVLASSPSGSDAGAAPPHEPGSTASPATYRGVYFREVPPLPGEDALARSLRARRLPADGDEARAVVERAERGRPHIRSLEARQRRLPPPELYDLTELQRHANRLFGFSAQKTLEIAQALYERHKLLSYPRTDSRHLSASVASTLPEIVEAIAEPYREHLSSETGTRPLGRRFVDDARVTDHHAIIPTTTRRQGLRLSGDEDKLYALVCTRLLAAWQPDHLYSTTVVITQVDSDPSDAAGQASPGPEPHRPEGDAHSPDLFRSTGTRVDRIGWRALEVGNGRAAGDDTDLPSELREGQAQQIVGAEAVQRQTRPPRAFTEATLLTAMETAGQTLDDDELSAAMRERGLGTPATRASIIETLLQRGYVERSRKSLRATDKGIHLVQMVHPDVKSPILTGRWEAQLTQMQRGEVAFEAFMHQIEGFVRQVVATAIQQRFAARLTGSASSASGVTTRPARTRDEPPGPPREAGPRSGADGPSTSPRVPASLQRDAPSRPARAPTPATELTALLKQTFGFDTFRPFQERVCRAVTEGRDSLLVMPTGAGKSLCYQLPGIARAGTTLVVSPLIALMEDQVASLLEHGLHARCIHSGRTREASRLACAEYLRGDLDFLFIAPERLRVRGFPEMLAKRLPTLIAIDEAHCISQWGHDFRPDYRMLKEHLAKLRPAPIVALTATATPRVQRDIVEQLDLPKPERFVHGFRRTNLGIELVEVPPAQRTSAVLHVLQSPERRPAIVYAASRKQAEELAARLARRCRAESYHAGMTAERRQQVHSAFRDGDLEVVVATIAFGMGIDKADVRTVVHTAQPRSIESYYQEIGRAGRDGAPSRAVLLHSFADQRMHQWFLDRDYPDVRDLQRVFERLTDRPTTLDELEREGRFERDALQRVLEKLWIHGGASVDSEDRICRGAEDWQTAYRAQRTHREAELDSVREYVSFHGCRMTSIVQHFGDREDSRRSCDMCDMCAPEQSLLLEPRPLEDAQLAALSQARTNLRERDGQTSGQLFSSLRRSPLDRNGFEKALAAAVRAGLVSEALDRFERDGSVISFRRVFLQSSANPEDPNTELRDYVPGRLERTAARRRGSSKAGPADRARSKPASGGVRPLPEAPAAVVALLKEWRRNEARRSRRPAFRILTDRTLTEIAAARPASEDQLLAIHGVGPAVVKRYGAALLSLLQGLADSTQGSTQ